MHVDNRDRPVSVSPRFVSWHTFTKGRYILKGGHAFAGSVRLRLMTTWQHFSESTVSGAYIVALGLICLLQYAVSLRRSRAARWAQDGLRRDLVALEAELKDVRKERTIARAENRMLRELLSEPDLQRALRLLLRRFVPNADRAIAAILYIEDDSQRTNLARGLPEQSCQQLSIDDRLLERLQYERSITLRGNSLSNSNIVDGLEYSNRGKFHELHLIAIGEPGSLRGVFLTSTLFPVGCPRSAQLELAVRLMTTVAGSLRRVEDRQVHQTQLRFAREMLELRSVADLSFETPMLMIEAFLDRLRKIVGADRIALFLVPRDVGTSGKAMVRCGIPLQRGVDDRWSEFEAFLHSHDHAGVCQEFDSDMLRRLGVDSLIGGALVVPLTRGHTRVGTIVLSRGEHGTFDASRRPLLDWASAYLSKTISKAVDHAVIERQARQDGLTGLANRRSFDSRIAAAVETADRDGDECSLLLVDLDDFKSINDSWGHLVGDEVLKSTAALLQTGMGRVLREYDQAFIARYGGEELAILLPRIGQEGALRIAESLRQTIEMTPIPSEAGDISLTASIGVAVCPLHARNVDEMIAAADEALYEAKNSGRNQVRSAVGAVV